MSASPGKRARALQCLQGLGTASAVMQRHCEDVGVAGVRRIAAGRAGKQVQRLRQALLADPQQALRVQQRRVARHLGQAFGQGGVGEVVLAGLAIELGKVGVGRREIRLQCERAAVVRGRARDVAAFGMEQAEVVARLGAVGVRLLGADVRVEDPLQARLGGGVLRGEVDRRQHRADLDPHRVGGVFGQRQREAQAFADRRRLQRIHRGGADQRIAVGQAAFDRGQQARAQHVAHLAQGGGAGDRRHARVRHQFGELARRVRGAGARGMQGGREGLEALAGRPERPFDHGCGPGLAAVAVATGAGVRRAERGAQVRPRDAEGVVVALVDDHVGAGRHVAGRACRARGPGRVQGVPRLVVLGGGVALAADLVAGQAQLAGMGIVAVGAGHPGGMHLALQERADVVDLLPLLAVVEVAAGLEQGEFMRVEQVALVVHPRDQRGAARMALRAGGQRAVAGERRAAPCIAGFRHRDPGRALALVQCHRQAMVRIGRGTRRRVARPRNMVRARPVAGLAGHVHFGEGGLVAISGDVVVPLQVGAVAIRAHPVPVLVEAGPVQGVAGLHIVVRVQVEPAAAALAGGPAVPGERQRLQAAVGECHQVLLQREDAEGVADLEVGDLAVGAGGAHHEAAALAQETGGRAALFEARIVEVAEHGGVGGVLHRPGMLRASPGAGFGGMAAGTGLGADEAGRGRRRKRRRPRGTGGAKVPGQQAQQSEGRGQPQQRKGRPLPHRIRTSSRNPRRARIVSPSRQCLACPA